MCHCSSVFLPTNDNLIGSTCRKTPNYDLCVSSFNSVPQSANAADVKSLADIMSSVVLKAKAQAAQSKFTELIKQGLKTQSLLTCADYYDIIIEFQISKQAYRGIKGVQPRTIALQAMDDTVALVNDCNNGLGRTFRGSPLVVMNANVINLAIVTKAIVQQLP